MKMYALVVGIADYKHINPLPATVVNDAQGLWSVLMDPRTCAYDKDRVTLLLNEQATRDGLRRAFKDAAQKCDNDSTFLLFVSCHGGRIENGKNSCEYLLPADTVSENEETLARTAISGERLTRYLKAIQARKLVAIFDCCHAAGIGQAKHPGPLRLKTGLSEQYYNQLKTGFGRVVFCSSRDTEYSYVRANDSNSIFTKHLLAGLRGGAPGPGGVIRVFDLFHYLQPKVTAEEPNQHPVFKCEVEDNFPIALHTGGKGSPLPTAPKDDFKYDVFISYSHHEPDRSWTHQILVPKLEERAIRVCIDSQFSLGRIIINQMERAVENSRYTLAVLSPAYLESNFAELENYLAEHVGLELGERRLLAVMRESCRPRLSMRARLWLDMQNADETDANVDRLVRELRLPPTDE